MYKLIKTILVSAVCSACVGIVIADEQLPPTEYNSPDHLYKIKLSKLDNKGGIDRTLYLKKQGKVMIAEGTIGYLQEVFWSPNGKYVAVNNRRAHFGDYLWVFSLDGKVVKKPDDPIERILKNDPYPEFHDEDLFRGYTFAVGWNKGNQLIIKETQLFKNMPEYLEYLYYCSISDDHLKTDRQEIHKKPRQ